MLHLFILFSLFSYSISFHQKISSIRVISKSPKFYNRLTSLNQKKQWFESNDEEENINTPIIPDDDPYLRAGTTLFDSIYDLSEQSEESITEISTLSLNDISEAYQFSLAFLGDFVIQLGCRPPIDIDLSIGDLLTGQQIYSLLEAINTLDPLESNIEYEGISARSLAYELNISESAIINIIERERLNLPYGIDTILHKSVVDKIIQANTFDEIPFTGHDNAIEMEPFQ